MRKLLLGILLGGFFLSVNAQKVDFSIYADPQFSWFSSDLNTIKPNGSVLNIHTGLEMNYKFQENYAFSFGVGINNMGGELLYIDSTFTISKGDSIGIASNSNVKYKIQYINIPIGLTLKTEEMGYLTFTFQVGFIPMFSINANITSPENAYDRMDVKESINLFNLNYYVGANVQYRLGGNTALIGGVKWSSGFTDVTKHDKANITVRNIALHIGVLF